MALLGGVAIIYLMITAVVCIVWLGLLILSIPFRIAKRILNGPRPMVTRYHYHRGRRTPYLTRSKRVRGR